ncbi:MFS transporter [Streptomyces sp. NPDC102360]|uniref:MFS transporter n=1 Tax=Streptomyces sp. NPDC102360 TaxID=3366160 RepID=UPI00380149EE
MTTTSAVQAGAEAPSRFTPRLTLILMALIWPTQVITVISVLGANATTGIAQHFHTTQIVWFTLIVRLLAAMITPFVIRLAARYGTKRVMLIMTGLGVIGDVLAAVAVNYPMLLVGRAIGAAYTPLAALTYPVVRDIFPKGLVKSATAILASTLALVSLFVPFLAAGVVDSWGFRGALWGMAIGTGAAFVLIATLVPETTRRPDDRGIGWLSGILLGLALVAILYPLGYGQKWGWTSGSILGLFALGAVLFVAFFVVERRSRNPIFDLAVLRRRPVISVLLSGAIAQSVAYTIPTAMILLALFPHIPGVSAGLGWSNMHNAWIGVPAAAVMFATGMGLSRIVDKVPNRLLFRVGLVFTMAGYALMAFHHHSATDLIWTGCVAQFGGGIMIATVPTLVVQVVAPEEQGLGSGMLNLLTLTLSSVYSAVMFATLAGHSRVLNGSVFYLDGGYKIAFLTAVVGAALALVVSLAIPKTQDV